MMVNGITCLTGIWLRTEKDHVLVDIEIGGQWYTVIREYAPLKEMEISHIVEPSGIEKVVAPIGRCVRCASVLNNVSPGFSIIAGGGKVCTPCLRPGEEIVRARGLS